MFNNVFREMDRYGREPKIDTFLTILSIIMSNWNNSNPADASKKSVYNNFLMILNLVLGGFYSSKVEPNNPSNIIQRLSRISMLDIKDIKKIEKMLEGIYKTKIEERGSKKEEVKEGSLDLKLERDHSESSVDYAIITALEDDEMEKVLPFIEKIKEVENSKHFIEIGRVKGNSAKKVVYASQHNTGMVDASILASELIIKFNPKVLIMVGVLGGKPEDTALGDVIVATKVFEIDRGKITDTGFKKEVSVATITNKEVKKISRARKQIELHLNSLDDTRNTEVKIHFGPIACVNQVIDLPDFFSESISTLDRKAIALEMESFAVVRACELLNEGKTTPVIIKSVMDNTQSKTDNAKPYAAWTSARTLEYILTNNII
jgi:nucleoside phosphorylase